VNVEKVIYALWRDPRQPAQDWCRILRTELADGLLTRGARSVQVNVFDEHAWAGADHIQGQGPLIEAVVQVWLDSANDGPRQRFDAIVADASWQMAAYLVTESVLQNSVPPAARGARTPCFSQMCLFRCLPALAREEWWQLWRNSHSDIMLATQGSFYYAQNLVVRPLTFGAPAFDAIAEECFPEAALTDPQVFFDAVGDDAKLQANRTTCMESISRFIDFGAITVIPTSQYRFD
jgi:hypothetical protein